jgi:starch phosphorylase
MSAIEPFVQRTRIAYFSMEIALRPEIHTYAGGLGILAGDTARSCADLDLPVVFVTLVSRAGYLRQEIGPDGQQRDHPDPWDPAEWATPLDAIVAVSIEGRPVWVRPWLHTLDCPVGHQAPVILLDTAIDQNEPADRQITDRLYGGDEADRLKQEIVLGIGGVRVLHALGFEIQTYHLNEGHAALLTLPLLRRHRRKAAAHGPSALLYDVDRVQEQCVFTTHTPVDAGHDRFPYELVQRLLGDIVELDQLKPLAGGDRLNMTRLALNLSGYVNGVAKRHAETAARMFPGYDIRAVTNGIHVPTWTHRSFARLYQAMVPNWGHEPELLMRADQLPDPVVWAAHQEAKAELLAEIARTTGTVMSPDVPLIGFARRMTGYKRPDLVFADVERLRAIHRRVPFQLVMAGKAHPRDEGGKRLIQDLHAHMRRLASEIPMAFLPNYEMALAHTLVSGTDIWLNTPLPPFEASGTSGMKAGLNGVLNVSTLDGWWLEACIEGVTGWAIGRDGDGGADHAQELYQKLEEVVLPLYHDKRDRWIWMMKQSISKIGAYFNSQRMMRRYVSEAYLR